LQAGSWGGVQIPPKAQCLSPLSAQKQENDVQNDRCVQRRVLLDYSADYPHRKRPPGKNYGYSLSNQRSTELRFSKKQKPVFFKTKQTQSQQQQQQTTPTSKLCVITNRLHLQQASMRESMSKTIRYRASNEVAKSQKKKKRNNQMINTLQTGIERLPP
jgi:hypothetical protein